MWDVWFADALLVLAIPLIMFSAHRNSPLGRLAREKEILGHLDEIQARYESGYLTTLILRRILPLLMTVYFSVKLFLLPAHAVVSGPNLEIFWTTVVVVTGICFAISVYWRWRDSRLVIQKYPALGECVSLSVPDLLIYLTSYLTLVTAYVLWLTDNTRLYALITLVSLANRQFVTKRHEGTVSPKDPIAVLINGVLIRSSLPERTVKADRSLMPDISLAYSECAVYTTILPHIFTDQEIACWFAFRASQKRKATTDKALILPTMFVLAVVGILLYAYLYAEKDRGTISALMIPILGFGFFAVTGIANWLFNLTGLISKQVFDLEFARSEYGEPFASCLEKLARYHRQPLRLIGVDRYLATETPLEDRLENLRTCHLLGVKV